MESIEKQNLAETRIESPVEKLVNGDEVDVLRSNDKYETGWTLGAILDSGTAMLHRTGDRNTVRNAEIGKLRKTKKVE